MNIDLNERETKLILTWINKAKDDIKDESTQSEFFEIEQKLRELI